jgi:hypothetical protein
MTTKDLNAQLAEQAPSFDAPLDELQTWMVQLIGHKKGLDKSEPLRQAADLHFTGNGRLSPAEQINIYRVQYWLRHTSVLIDHFDGLSRWLGQERWQALAESYLEDPRSQVFAITELGHRMGEHIASLPPFFDQALCVDMARLEWAYQCAFSAADDPVLSLEKMQTIAPDAWMNARFSVSDSLNLLTLRHPVCDLRRALRAEEEVERTQALATQELRVVVYRRDRVLYDKQLSTPAFLLLAELARDTPLIPACEAVIEQCSEAAQLFEEQLMHWFALWGRLGWITDVRV